ncbi:hypothetical protein [Pseudonocardia sp. WMMC193]|uniref:hypothetical protein n=1 Tax=Pseudonocardia sp. WMMC193 TaxID=2911965 RepID=UPI0027DF968F|nr:hypothetical protein [Pseudonocardia sp. WMMC193]
MTHATTLPLHMRRDRFDPVPELGALRERPGLTKVRTPMGLEPWLVTRWADVREVLGDPARFSNAFVAPMQQGRSPEEIARMRAGNLLPRTRPSTPGCGGC